MPQARLASLLEALKPEPPRQGSLMPVRRGQTGPPTTAAARGRAGGPLDAPQFEARQGDAGASQPPHGSPRQAHGAAATNRTPKPAGNTRPFGGTGPSWQDFLLRWPRQRAKAEASPEPLKAAITREMDQVKTLLGQGESGRATQQLQRRIVAQLDELIRQAQERSGAGGPQELVARKVARPWSVNSPRPSPAPRRAKPGTQPAKAAAQGRPGEWRTGAGGAAALRAQIDRFWGTLPERQRGADVTVARGRGVPAASTRSCSKSTSSDLRNNRTIETPD